MSAASPQHDDHQSGLEPPRFSLRTLMLAVTVAGCLFGLMVAVGSLWSMAILMILALVAAHVLGNLMGTRLRDRATREAILAKGLPAAGPPPAVLPLQMPAPPRLAERARLSRVTRFMSFGEALAGALLGGVVSAFVYPEAGTAAVGLGVVSAAVLGSFVGFAASSFVSVARAAIGEALGDPSTRRVSHHPPR